MSAVDHMIVDAPLHEEKKLGINARTFVTLQWHAFHLEYFHGGFR